MGYHVHLPTYAMLGVPRNGTVEVLVPDNYLGADGRLNRKALRTIYRGNPLWDHARVGLDVQVGP